VNTVFACADDDPCFPKYPIFSVEQSSSVSDWLLCSINLLCFVFLPTTVLL